MEQTRTTLRSAPMLEILDQAFRVYREKFGLVLAIVGIGTVPATALNILNTVVLAQRLLPTSALLSTRSASYYNDYMNRFFLTLGVSVVAAMVIGLLNTLLISAPLAYLTSERTMGRSVSIGQAYKALRGRFAQVAAGVFLFYMLMLLLGVVSSVALIACGAGIAVFVFFGINTYAFLLPVLVLERHGFVYSIRRAWSLAKARFWPLFWMTLAVYVMTFFIAAALGLLRQWVMSGTISAVSTTGSLLVQTVFQAFIGMFLAPILPIAYTLMYYDTRVREEGLDIALKSVAVPDASPGDVPTPPPGPFMVRKDWSNLGMLALLGLVPVVLYFCVVFAITLSLPALYR